MKRLLVLFAALSLVVAVAVPALAAGSAKSVTLKNFQFSPKKLTVKKGTKINWAFKDGSVDHNVTVKSGPAKFKSGNRSSGTFSRTLTKAGTYKIVCTLHEDGGMVQTVVVK